MFDWKRILLVSRREIATRTKQRSYRISLFAQLLIVALLAVSPVLIAKFKGDDSGEESYKILVVENENSNLGNTLQLMLPTLGQDDSVTWEVSAAESAESARAAVDNDTADAAIIAVGSGTNQSLDIVTSNGDPQNSLAQTLTVASASVIMQDRIHAAGLTPEQQLRVFALPDITMTNAKESDGIKEDFATQTVNYVIAYGGTVLIFVLVIMYGQWISQGVVEEKASRIMEIMINAATPRDLLAGKVIGIMVTAIMQIVPITLLAGMIASNQKLIGGWLGVPENKLFDIDLAGIAWSSIGWFSLYFLLGFLLFGSLYAGVGSLVSRQEEVSTAVAPMTTIMMVGYFAAFASLGSPDGMIARVAYLFPGTSVFVALVRLLLGNPQPWEIAVSILGLIVAIVLAMLLAARLYKVGVLLYGQTPGFKSLFKLRDMQTVAR